jgi:hypothetical protein
MAMVMALAMALDGAMVMAMAIVAEVMDGRREGKITLTISSRCQHLKNQKSAPRKFLL